MSLRTQSKVISVSPRLVEGGPCDGGKLYGGRNYKLRTEGEEEIKVIAGSPGKCGSIGWASSHAWKVCLFQSGGAQA